MPSRIQNIRKYLLTSGKRYYRQVTYPSIPTSIDDTYIITKDGDRLDLLAYHFYQDSDLWWVISMANPNKIKRDSPFITPGTQIRIPQDIESILEDFESLNQ